MEVVPFGQSGGSIVGISPGIAIAQGGSGGGSIVGITPGMSLLTFICIQFAILSAVSKLLKYKFFLFFCLLGL